MEQSSTPLKVAGVETKQSNLESPFKETWDEIFKAYYEEAELLESMNDWLKANFEIPNRR